MRGSLSTTCGTQLPNMELMSISPPKLLERLEPWRRKLEIGFWLALYAVNAVANSVTATLDLERRGIPFAAWEPVLWESSSALALLALVPAVVWFSSRAPLSWTHWRRSLAWHLGGSVAYSLLHVLGMVAVRHAGYAAMGGQYDFGDWGSELFYEYLKDVRSYASVLALIEGYRFVLRRLAGEARWLDRPDNDRAPASPEYPERFLVKMLGKEFLVPAERIERATAAANYVNLHVGDRDYPLRSTMTGLLDKLDPTRFRRIHRSHIVNLDHVREIEPLESGDARVVMHDGAQLPVSRRYRSNLAED